MKTDLYIDIGNTSIDLLFGNKFDDSNYHKFYLNQIDEVIKILKDYNCSNAYITSVNKNIEQEIIQILDDFKIKYHFVRYEIMKEYADDKLYIIPNLNILGYDLFCDLIADRNNQNQIIIDLGTVSKILVIQNKKFLGGTLLPGIKSFSKAISSTTNLSINEINNINLPLLNYETSDCVNSGTLNGMAIIIKNMAYHIKLEYNLEDCVIYLTGGDAKYLIEKLNKDKFDFIYDKYLVLKGLQEVSNYYRRKHEIK